MTRRTTPTKDIKTSAPKPVTNYSRLLKILERNAASVREPELVKRLRSALRTLVEEKSC
jgi:hypothetical protein